MSVGLLLIAAGVAGVLRGCWVLADDLLNDPDGRSAVGSGGATLVAVGLFVVGVLVVAP